MKTRKTNPYPKYFPTSPNPTTNSRRPFPSPPHPNTLTNPKTPNTAANTIPNHNVYNKKRTSVEFKEKQAKGICFWCNDKFVQGIRCQGRRTGVLVGDRNNENELPTEADMQDTSEEEMVETGGLAHISIQALSGLGNFKCLRITG